MVHAGFKSLHVPLRFLNEVDLKIQDRENLNDDDILISQIIVG